jgi:hypothetical protein
MNDILFENSFASHEKAKYWSDKNELKPNEITKGSSKKFWFNCNECGHEFLQSPNNISTNSWCAYCNSYKLCDNTECKICFEKSFASHEKAKYWNTKNELPARQGCKFSGK